MKRFLLYDVIGWGVGLWCIGYLLGILLFFIVPASYIGWILTPIGLCITLWILWKKVRADSMKKFFLLSVAWTLIAVLFDYLFIVQLLKPADGYYKLDVYIYYFLTFLLPVGVGWGEKSCK